MSPLFLVASTGKLAKRLQHSPRRPLWASAQPRAVTVAPFQATGHCWRLNREGISLQLPRFRLPQTAAELDQRSRGALVPRHSSFATHVDKPSLRSVPNNNNGKRRGTQAGHKWGTAFVVAKGWSQVDPGLEKRWQCAGGHSQLGTQGNGCGQPVSGLGQLAGRPPRCCVRTAAPPAGG